MESETKEIVDLVHSLVIQSRPPAIIETSAAFKLKSSSSTSSLRGDPTLTPVRTPQSSGSFTKKKVAIKSAPLKPPDIGNASLFPTVEESVISSPTSNSSAARRISLSGAPEVDKKLQTLEAKLTQPLPPQSVSSTPRRVSLNEISGGTPSPSSSLRTKAPRSAKLFSELSSERRAKLDELAVKYATSINSNLCRSVLDELEFLFQIFNASTTGKLPQKENSSEIKEIQLLQSTGEQTYFAIKVIITQLEPVFTSVPPFVLQLIVENYPHKIPKPVRKHIEDWLESQKAATSSSGANTSNSLLEDEIPAIDLRKTVTFQSDKDGRANFPLQTDFHAFCKQRDLFYSIRENWSSTGGNTPSAGGMITDRSKSRMSFPPGPTRGQIVDSLSFKVQALFQLNRSPTNLAHMASLFVSHYLLEARAAEVGGVPKDEGMKEFFQSNPAKLLQLNSRFAGSGEESEKADNDEDGEVLAFQKQFLLAASPKFGAHVVDRLVLEVNQAEAFLDAGDLTPRQICRTVKDTVHLARLLGFALLLPYLTEDSSSFKPVSQTPTVSNTLDHEAILQEQLTLRVYQRPPLDLKLFLERALRLGRLMTTCPWLIELLLQSDRVTLQLPAYRPVLACLLSIYRTTLTSGGDNDVRISSSCRNFLRFYFGHLFASPNFPDFVFSLRQQDLESPSFEANSGDVIVDKMEGAGRSLLEFFFEGRFTAFKRILSWGKLQVSNPSITGDFRHIRPIPAPPKSATTSTSSSSSLSKEKLLQIQLEATFFELYPPAMKRSVEFIAERMSANFVIIAKTQLFPNFRTTLANQGIFGVRAAEKCRVRLGEELFRFLGERCSNAVKLFLEPSVTPGVLGLCQRIAVRKAKETAGEWMKSSINPSMFPEIEPGTPLPVGGAPAKAPVPEDPPFEILILIHRSLRKLHSGEKLDPQLIDKVLACQTLGKATWATVPLVDFCVGLITFQPQVLNVVRLRGLLSLWKSLLSTTGSVSSVAQLLNPRNLMLLSKSSTDPRDSWMKLGSLAQLMIGEGMLSPAELEAECFSLLREDWPEPVHRRMSEFLTIVLESFHDEQQRRGAGLSSGEWSESAQVLDWVAWLCSGQPDQD